MHFERLDREPVELLASRSHPNNTATCSRKLKVGFWRVPRKQYSRQVERMLSYNNERVQGENRRIGYNATL